MAKYFLSMYKAPTSNSSPGGVGEKEFYLVANIRILGKVLEKQRFLTLLGKQGNQIMLAGTG